MLTDWASGTQLVDVMVLAPQWQMVDYGAGGYLEELTPRITKDKDLQWDQIAPFFRNFSATYGGKTYLIPLDGDFHMLYYRTDILDKAGLKPPKTWEEYLEVAKASNGKEVDLEPRSTAPASRSKEAQRWELLVHHRHHRLDGAVQGNELWVPSSTPRTARPLIDSEAFRKALDFLERVPASTARRTNLTWT